MRNFIGTLGFLILANCAQITAIPVLPGEPLPNGIPIYGHKPILLVGADGLKIETIPNLSERYAIQLNSFFAKNETDLTISQTGLLNKVEANLDSAAALQPLLDFARDVLAAKADIPSLKSEKLSLKEVAGVYEFVFLDDGSLELKEIFSVPQSRSNKNDDVDETRNQSEERTNESERGTLSPESGEDEK